MLTFVYIANIRLPTEKAHGLQIMKTCEAMVRQGVEVELIVPRRRNYIKDDPFDYYDVKRNFKITRLGCLDFILGKFSYWLLTWTFFMAVKSHLKSRLFDVHYTRDLYLALVISKPVFYEIHTLPERPRFYHVLAWQRAKKLIVISDGLKKDLVQSGVPESKIVVVRDAVDIAQFDIKESTMECRQKLGLPLDKKIVLYTGHLYGWKGADILAMATEFLSQVEVYLAGGTANDLRKFKEKYNFSNLHLVGWQEHKMIPFWLKAADLLVLPTSGRESRGEKYTSPMKLFEYMVSKRLIVASDIPSLREVLDESNATFFTPDDPYSLAKKIQTVLAHPEEAEEKAASAYNVAVEKYSWKNRAELIKNFILTP